FKLLTRLFHGVDRLRQGSVNTGIFARIKAVHRSCDSGDIFGALTVEDECRSQVFAIGGKTEALRTTPAEPDDCQLAVGSRDLFGVIGRRVKVSGHLAWIKFGIGFTCGVPSREVTALATVWSHSGKQIW